MFYTLPFLLRESQFLVYQNFDINFTYLLQIDTDM